MVSGTWTKIDKSYAFYIPLINPSKRGLAARLIIICDKEKPNDMG